VAALLAAGCSDASRPAVTAPQFDAATGGTGITLDQSSGLANDAIPSGQGETHVGKGFDPNPHPGDAIIATFFWKGSSNTIVNVTDHFCDVNATPIGNTYTLVDYVTRGGNSMATYVATNAQGFSAQAVSTDSLVCVHAIFSNQISEGGVIISAYRGVAAATALAGYHSATGFDSTTAPVDPGAITGATGDLAYAVAMSDGVVGSDPPAGFANITDVSDTMMRADGEYAVLASSGTVEPRWTWYFQSPHSWLATVLALSPASGTANQPPVAAFGSSCSGLTCAFADSSSDPDGSIASHSWTFGDGGSSTAQNPSHTYAAAGTYTVTLTVTDNQGATSAPASRTVSVTGPNQAPVVNAGPDETALTGLLYTLNWSFSDPDNGPWSYTIDWGDGATTTGSASSPGSLSNGHTYVTVLPHNYTVTVTVVDSNGASGSDSKVVSVLIL
jgi:PKD repeat protein